MANWAIPLHAQETKQWSDRDGNAIEAALVGYDFETKKVEWMLPNGSAASSPLENLSDESKWTALLEGPVHDAMNERWKHVFDEKSVGIILIALLVLLVLFAGLLLLDFLCFKVTIRILTFPHRDLFAYLKLLIAGFVFAIVIQLIFVFIMALTGTDLSLLASLLQSLAAVAITIMILSGHYEISAMRAFSIHILRGVISFFAMAIVLVGGLAIAYFSGLKFVDSLVLKPLELI